MLTDNYKKNLDENKYGYSYNPPGFEVPYALAILSNLNENDLCSEIIDLFEKNKMLQKRGTTALGVNEKLKKSIDMTIQPNDLN